MAVDIIAPPSRFLRQSQPCSDRTLGLSVQESKCTSHNRPGFEFNVFWKTVNVSDCSASITGELTVQCLSRTSLSMANL
jgi:hypothetical protein